MINKNDYAQFIKHGNLVFQTVQYRTKEAVSGTFACIPYSLDYYFSGHYSPLETGECA